MEFIRFAAVSVVLMAQGAQAQDQVPRPAKVVTLSAHGRHNLAAVSGNRFAVPGD